MWRGFGGINLLQTILVMLISVFSYFLGGFTMSLSPEEIKETAFLRFWLEVIAVTSVFTLVLIDQNSIWFLAIFPLVLGLIYYLTDRGLFFQIPASLIVALLFESKLAMIIAILAFYLNGASSLKIKNKKSKLEVDVRKAAVTLLMFVATILLIVLN